MSKRQMRVIGFLIFAIGAVAPLVAQTRDQVPVPADSFGRRVRIKVTGSGNAPNGEFTTGTRQFGGRPTPPSWGPVYSIECEGGPFPSGFDFELIETKTDTREIQIVFKARKDCNAPAKVGSYSVSEAATAGQPYISITSSKLPKGCDGAGAGTVTVNRYDVYSSLGKVLGSPLRVGFLDASFSITCIAGGVISGTVEMSEDSIEPTAVLLNPEDAPSGGDGGGGTTEPPPPPPPPDATVGFPTTLLEEGLAMTNDSSTTVKVSTITQNNFSGDVDLEVVSDATEEENFSVSLSPGHIPAPGIGESTLTIKVGPNTFPRDYFVTVATTANGKVAFNSLRVTVLCDPPMILGIDQPRGATISGGGSATLEGKAVGSGPFTYQWFTGPPGSTNFPVSGGTGSKLTTSSDGMYWVRIANACGSADSASAVVTRR